MIKNSASGKNRSQLMGSQPIGKLLWRFSLPGVIAMLINAMYNMVDTIFVGGLGPKAIAALTVVFPVQMAFIALAAGTGIGASSLISRRLGEGKTEEANKVVGQTLLIALIAGALIALLGVVFGHPLLEKLLGAPAEIVKPAFSYMIVITSGSLIVFINIIGNNLVRAEGNPKLPMITMIMGALINIGLDPILIYGLKMGVQGAAIATITARGISAIVLLAYLFGKKTSFKLKKEYFKLKFSIWKEVYMVGGPHTLMSLVGSLTLVIINNVASKFGFMPIAALGILFKISQFGFMPCLGISTGALPIVGFNYGAGNLERVKATISRVILISGAITFTVALLTIIFSSQIVSIFNRDPDFLPMATRAMRIAFLGFAFTGTQVAFGTFFQGIGKGLPAAIIGISRQLLILVPALLLLVHFFGQDGIWFALPIADTLSFILGVIWTGAAARKLGIHFFSKTLSNTSA